MKEVKEVKKLRDWLKDNGTSVTDFSKKFGYKNYLGFRKKLREEKVSLQQIVTILKYCDITFDQVEEFISTEPLFEKDVNKKSNL